MFIIILGIFNLIVIALSDMWKEGNPQDVKGCNMISLAAFTSYVWIIFHA